MMMVWLNDGRKVDSGSLMASVSAFGAVAPTNALSSRAAPDTVMATFGSESLLQANVRMSVLMSRPTRPAAPRSSRAPSGPVSSAELIGACVTWAMPPQADMCIYLRDGFPDAAPFQALDAFVTHDRPRYRTGPGQSRAAT